MNSKFDKTLADKGFVLPQQPRILAEIEELMRKPNVNLRAIATLVSHDPILKGIFLRTVNSSYYGLDHEIESAEQAVPMIGLQQTLNIIRAEALNRATGGAQALANRRLYERAQQISRLSTIIAGHYLPEYISPEIAYLVGQFHDCGIAVIMQRYPGYCASLCSQSNYKLPDLFKEDRSVGADHSEIGYNLAKDWKLPTMVCAAIRCHHAIERADDDTRYYVATLQMAMHLYNRMRLNDDSEWETTRAGVMQTLEITEGELGEFESSVREAFREQTREA